LPRFVRKRFLKTSISHEEASTVEFHCLDYTPIVTVKPIDLATDLRPVKAGRKIRMFICGEVRRFRRHAWSVKLFLLPQ